jgi:dTDP-4-amino-4,6-dideoxygalactose transaminase
MVQNDKIWLSSPHMGASELKYVNRAFETNWIAPLGPHVNDFETDLCNYTGAKHAAALSSGTAALHLSLILLGVQPGDLVLCQSMTFSASANPIVYQGAIPIFIDSEPDTWNMSPQHLERAIKAALNGELIMEGRKLPAQKPKAIIPVHLYGMPAKIQEIMEIASAYNIPIVEDAAESLGAFYRNKHTGTYGEMGILSFNGNKIITTSGGGALISEHSQYINRARFLATQARDEAPHYQHSHIGYNYRMSNVLAGIGRGQMEVLNLRVEQRRANYQRYFDYFQALVQKGFKVTFQNELPHSRSNRWLTAIFVEPKNNKGISRETIRIKLEADNIESRPLWKPMHLQPVFEKYPFFGDGTSELLFENGLCLPSGSNLTEQEFSRIFSELDAVFSR